MAGTLVVRTSPKGTVPPVSIWKTHLKVLGVWFLIVVGISIFVPYLGQKMGAGKVLGLYESLESSGKFRAATVLDKYPEVMKDDLLSIEMIYGYDFGIAWSWQKWWVRYRPSRWQEFVSNPELMLQVMMQEMRQRGEQKK